MSEPVANALLLCNYATTDKMSRWTLVEIFDSFQVASVPCQTTPFFIFAHIVDAPKVGFFVFSITDQNETVYWSSGPVPFELKDESPKRLLNAVYRVSTIMLMTCGRFRVSMSIGPNVIAGVDLVVTKMENLEPKK